MDTKEFLNKIKDLMNLNKKNGSYKNSGFQK